MMARSIPTPLWFAAALFPMVVSQIVRLQQSDPAAWIVWDYAGRLGALAVLSAIPAARTIAFRFEPLRIARWEVTIWIVGIVLADHYLGGWIRRTINGVLPATVLGAYPEVQGWLHVVDIFFGLGLVALVRRSYSAAVRVICSRAIWMTAMPWFSQHLFCLEPITGGRVSGILARLW